MMGERREPLSQPDKNQKRCHRGNVGPSLQYKTSPHKYGGMSNAKKWKS